MIEGRITFGRKQFKFLCFKTKVLLTSVFGATVKKIKSINFLLKIITF